MIDSVGYHSATSAATATMGLRPYSKRQQVMQELTSDSDLLLKDRLEVRHLMTRNPVTIQAAATIEEMTKLMTDLRLHHLLVCNRAGDLVGVVSDRDLRPTRGATAQQVMSYPPMTCTPDTAVTEAITFLRNENISCLPVVDHGQPIGVLTTGDLVLTLQCTLQLSMRMAQVLQQNLIWSQELDKIIASLEGPLTADELAERVVAARRAIRQEIQDLVNVVDLRTDSLTGVSNRQELQDILGMLLAVKARYQRPFSLAIVTVDHYHRIRETCGDAVVKPLLKAVARVIDDHVRTSDFVARCRDDAFAVVLTETRLDEAENFRARILADAHEHSTLDMKLRITANIVEAETGESVADLLARAEGAAKPPAE
ncbi:MAG: CBS domain-containing protein [Thermoguttaceae bacterium]